MVRKLTDILSAYVVTFHYKKYIALKYLNSGVIPRHKKLIMSIRNSCDLELAFGKRKE